MANEELTIAKEKARLTVIGNSYPDTLTDSGLGLDLSQIIFDILIDLDIPMPDIDFDDLDDIIIIPGLGIDTEIPTLEYPDPDWPDDEIPPIIDWPMPDLDWDDFIDKLEDLDIDIDILKDLSFVGLNDLEIPELVFLDEDFNIQMDELPASIEIVTPPNKLEYQDGERIDLTGMVVTAKKEDGSTWTNARYPNGHIPLGELIIEPTHADYSQASKSGEGTADYEGYEIPYVTGAAALMVRTVGSREFTYSNYDMDSFFFILTDDPYMPQPVKIVVAFPNAIKGAAVHGIYTDSDGKTYDSTANVSKSYTPSGTVWWGYYGYTYDYETSNLPLVSGISATKAAEIITYGNRREAQGGVQAITISWDRYGDGETLPEALNIQVEPRAGGNGGR